MLGTYRALRCARDSAASLGAAHQGSPVAERSCQLLKLGLAIPCWAIADRWARGSSSVTGDDRLQAVVTVGKVFQRERIFSPDDVKGFLDVSGDANAIHTDDAAARLSGFDGAVLPGSLGASLFPAIIGSAFPGAIYARQTLHFKRPAYVGSPVTAELSVKAVKELRGRLRVDFDTKLFCSTSGGLCIDGEATALLPAAR